MPLLENTSLKSYNTFGIEVNADYLAAIKSVEDLQAALTDKRISGLPRLVLGGGSNVLFTGDYHGLILRNELKGIELTHTDAEYYYIKAGAGEDWHPFVLKTIEMAWYGLENLSLIPGKVGASPMQNIGAYGIEIKDRFEQLEAYELATGKIRVFNAADCAFGYRESVFKNELKNQYIITSVTFKLLRKPEYRVDYGAIREELTSMGVSEFSAKAISDAVVRIRSIKLI